MYFPEYSCSTSSVFIFAHSCYLLAIYATTAKVVMLQILQHSHYTIRVSSLLWGINVSYYSTGEHVPMNTELHK